MESLKILDICLSLMKLTNIIGLQHSTVYGCEISYAGQFIIGFR